MAEIKEKCPYCDTEKTLDGPGKNPLKTICPNCKRPFRVKSFKRD